MTIQALKPFLLGLALAVLAAVTNYFALPLLFGADFIFGSIFMVVALVYLGRLPAIGVALVGASYTYFLWGHPYALVIMTLEAIFVAAVTRHQRVTNILFADIAYWLLIGIPLVIYFYSEVLNLDLQQALFIAAKQSLNGSFNVVIGNLIALAICAHWPNVAKDDSLCALNIQTILFNILLSFSLVAGAAPVIVENFRLKSILESQVYNDLSTTINRIISVDKMEISEQSIQQWAKLRYFPNDQTITIRNDQNIWLISNGIVSNQPSTPYHAIDSVKTSNRFTLVPAADQTSKLKQWSNGHYQLIADIGGENLIIISAPAENVVDTLQTEKIFSFALLTAITFLAILISHLISKLFSRPITRLSKSSKDITANIIRGDDFYVEKSNILEYSILSESLDTMAHSLQLTVESLQTANSSLELKIQRRTAEIEKLSLVARKTKSGVLIGDDYENIEWHNEALTHMLGIKDGRVKGLPILQVVKPKSVSQHAEFTRNIMSKTNFKLTLECECASGDSIWVDLEWICITTSDKKDSFIAIISDITVQKLSQEKLTEYALELEINNSSLAIAKEKAEESARIKSEFLASMSHEIRTPMNGVLGMLGLLNRGSLDRQQQHYSYLAMSSAEALLVTINEILDFSKIESGQLLLENLDFNLLKLLSDFTETIAPKAHEKGLLIVLDTSKMAISQVCGDPSRIRQILNNLVGNAIKFTDAGNITITTSTAIVDDKVLLNCTVEDTGIGIDDNQVEVLFEAFKQADASTTRKYGGTGLGLSITKKLCEQMHGSITAKSRSEGGSRFTFAIPLAISDKTENYNYLLDLQGVSALIIKSSTIERAHLAAQLRAMGASVFETDSVEQYLADHNHHQFNATTSHAEKWVFIDHQEIDNTNKLDGTFTNGDAKRIILVPIDRSTGIKLAATEYFSHYLRTPLTPINLYNLANTLLKNHSHDAEDNSMEKAAITQEAAAIKVLLVEDNAINQELAINLLGELGLDIDIADNGLAAIDRLTASHKIDTTEPVYKLIFMDCQMPELDGYETTKRIRKGLAGQFYRNTPIIAMTANAMAGDREKCLRAGMSDYIAKPLEFDLLKSTVRHWINRVSNIGPHAFESTQLETTGVLTEQQQEGVNAVLTAAQVWDKEDALKRVRNKPERLAKIAALFLRDMPARIEKLIASIESNKVQSIKEVAHETKGVASNLSAIRLFEISQALDKNHNDHTSCMALIPELKEVTKLTISLLEEFCQSQKESG